MRLALRSVGVLVALFVLMMAKPILAQSSQTADAPFDFGTDWINLPPGPRVNQTSPRTVQLLGEALTDEPTAERRIELASDLGTCALPSAAPFLVHALADGDEAVRAAAARSAGEIGAKEMLPQLRTAMADPSDVVRREAVCAGATLADASIVAQALSDADPSVFVAACQFATTAEQANSIATRLRRTGVTEALSVGSRVAAIAALGRLHDPAHIDDILGFLDATVPEQIAAARALAIMDAVGAADRVAALLRNPNPTVRREAVTAMTQLAATDRRSAIAQQMLDDPDYTVQAAAAKLLASAPTPSPAAAVVPILIKQLAIPDVPLHDAAIGALIASNADDAAAALLDSPNPRRREDGSYILGQLKSAAGLDRHIALLQDADWNVVDQAARSLGAIGRPQAAEALGLVTQHIPTLNAIPAQQLAAASIACGDALVSAIKLGNTAALENGRPLIGNIKAPEYSRAAAIWAFGALGNADSKTCRRLIAIINDPLETTDAPFESMKALGNLRYRPASQTLVAIETTSSDLNRWMAQAALNRIDGTSSPFVPTPILWRAKVSITDLADRN